MNEHNDEPAYSSNQVAALIRAAVAEERERCAKVVEEHNPGGSYHIRTALALAIRQGGA
jgi:hypothetical protein